MSQTAGETYITSEEVAEARETIILDENEEMISIEKVMLPETYLDTRILFIDTKYKELKLIRLNTGSQYSIIGQNFRLRLSRFEEIVDGSVEIVTFFSMKGLQFNMTKHHNLKLSRKMDLINDNVYILEDKMKTRIFTKFCIIYCVFNSFKDLKYDCCTEIFQLVENIDYKPSKDPIQITVPEKTAIEIKRTLSLLEETGNSDDDDESEEYYSINLRGPDQILEITKENQSPNSLDTLMSLASNESKEGDLEVQILDMLAVASKNHLVHKLKTPSKVLKTLKRVLLEKREMYSIDWMGQTNFDLRPELSHRWFLGQISRFSSLQSVIIELIKELRKNIYRSVTEDEKSERELKTLFHKETNETFESELKIWQVENSKLRDDVKDYLMKIAERDLKINVYASELIRLKERVTKLETGESWIHKNSKVSGLDTLEKFTPASLNPIKLKISLNMDDFSERIAMNRALISEAKKFCISYEISNPSENWIRFFQVRGDGLCDVSGEHRLNSCKNFFIAFGFNKSKVDPADVRYKFSYLFPTDKEQSFQCLTDNHNWKIPGAYCAFGNSALCDGLSFPKGFTDEVFLIRVEPFDAFDCGRLTCETFVDKSSTPFWINISVFNSLVMSRPIYFEKKAIGGKIDNSSPHLTFPKTEKNLEWYNKNSKFSALKAVEMIGEKTVGLKMIFPKREKKED